MKRTEIIQKLRDAKEAHLQWLRRAKHLVSGLPIDNDMIPLDPTLCDFGHWLYAEGMKCKILTKLSNQLNEIERTHSDLHKVYVDIYKIYFIEKKRSFLSSIVFGKKNIISYKEKKDATYFYYELEHISDKLTLQLTKLEQSIKVVSDEVINRCVA